MSPPRNAKPPGATGGKAQTKPTSKPIVQHDTGRVSSGTVDASTPLRPWCAADSTWSVSGTVRRLPEPGAYKGNSLILDPDDGPPCIALPATAKAGATVLERILDEQEIVPGEHVEVAYHGMRETKDGQRTYRYFTVEVDR